ncbi:hypothetical protein [Mucilaginibacter sp. BT774]|uniref:hypothetical protein n=1 Tax=Mucilaginibacter sp. BT774 TaxID=3062276 RepID=UPI00267527A2|nr:hypothetical protein [Mucilaginibacter sp. BT774]MDO3625834.1 hypothetical protein [Mucilaginibacter sp. BT774]
MKNTPALSALFFLAFALNACKKENHKPANTTPITSVSQTTQSLVGKWYVVKDSIQAFDLYTPISFQNKLSFSNADYVTFGKDSTGVISSQVAFKALYTDYIKLYINPNQTELPNLNFKYYASLKNNTLQIPNIDALNGIGYSIVKLSPTELVLFTQDEIPTPQHDYRFKQYIYFTK